MKSLLDIDKDFVLSLRASAFEKEENKIDVTDMITKEVIKNNSEVLNMQEYDICNFTDEERELFEDKLKFDVDKAIRNTYKVSTHYIKDIQYTNGIVLDIKSIFRHKYLKDKEREKLFFDIDINFVSLFVYILLTISNFNTLSSKIINTFLDNIPNLYSVFEDEYEMFLNSVYDKEEIENINNLIKKHYSIIEDVLTKNISDDSNYLNNAKYKFLCELNYEGLDLGLIIKMIIIKMSIEKLNIRPLVKDIFQFLFVNALEGSVKLKKHIIYQDNENIHFLAEVDIINRGIIVETNNNKDKTVFLQRKIDDFCYDVNMYVERTYANR